MAALGDDAEVPATLRALLAARLDRLDAAERGVLERGAVEGELFHRGTVQALASEGEEVTQHLAALVRRDLVRPDRPQLPREDAYRFRHLLIRDAAYDALPKAMRADLHRRFAGWLAHHGRSLVELDEILGYHLEQAARYLTELMTPDPALAEEASRRLAVAGERMYWRGDRQAAHSLFRRAVELVDEPDIHLAVEFAISHTVTSDAERLLEDAARQADVEEMWPAQHSLVRSQPGRAAGREPGRPRKRSGWRSPRSRSSRPNRIMRPWPGRGSRSRTGPTTAAHATTT
jgi:hypothetical protein